MADNDTAKNASGATVTYAADDVGGVKYVRAKSVWGADGAVNDTSAAAPFPVEIISSSDLTITDLTVGGYAVVIKPTITVTAGAYSAGDVVGGEIALTNAMRASGGSGVLTDFILTTADGETPELHVLIFDSNPASNVADNGAFSWGSGDWGRLLGDVHVAAADWYTLGGDGVCHKQGVNIGVVASGSADLYCYIVAVGTPTFAATSDLTAAFKFLQN